MKSLSGVGIGLSLVFGCLLLALIAEIYYLLWCKNKTINHHRQHHPHQILTCCKNPSTFISSTCIPSNHDNDNDLQSSSFSSSNNKPLFKIEALPRFLLPIKEETMEDLECATKESTNLGDLLLLPSPIITNITPTTLVGIGRSHNVVEQELIRDAAFNRMRASPPPTFNFLRRAEEKRMMMLLMDTHNLDAIS